MLDWLILGGGPHGTHLALVLTRRCGVATERVGVLDPHAEPLARWWQCAANTGMRHLRSPIVHHLGLGPWDLRDHARARGFDGKIHFAPPYDRPSVALFRDHCRALEVEHGLGELRLRGLAHEIAIEPRAVRVDTSRGTLRARNVVLALGGGDTLHRPRWASALLLRGAAVHHLFEAGFEVASVGPRERVAVVGGGISAAQVALALAERGVQVVLVRRHPPRVHTFDSDPGWVGPKNMRAFLAERDPARRRSMIRAARHRGSMPEEIAEALGRAVAEGRLRLAQGEVDRAMGQRGGPVGLSVGGELLAVDRVVLATGFGDRRPGGRMLDALIAREGLPCAACGWPQIGPDLRWHARVVVSGSLAELELGPTARNLVGARRAAERLAKVA